MKITLRVKRMLPTIYEAMDNKEAPKDIMLRFTLTPQLYRMVRAKYIKEKEEKTNV
jgi:hypothetical protein